MSAMLEVHASFSWTQGAVAGAGWLDWLSDLPLEARLTLPDGARLLAVHASPGRDDGPGITPDTDRRWCGAREALIEATADGHRLELRRVPYDTEAAIAALARVRHPSLEYLSRRYRGQHTPDRIAGVIVPEAVATVSL